MGAHYRVHITTDALRELEDIFKYLSDNSPQNARNVTDTILKRVRDLTVLPSRHKVVGRSRKTDSPVHRMVVHPYLVYYRVEEDPAVVSILTVRHGARRQPRRFP